MREHYDVVVVGGGPAGFSAGVGAARAGADVLLVERYGFLGGTATTALVHPFVSPFAGEEMVNSGIFKDLVDRLIERGAASTEIGLLPPLRPGQVSLDSSNYGPHIRFDPEVLKIVCDEMIAEVNASVLFHTLAMDAIVEGSAIRGVVIENVSGRRSIFAEVIVDASGDGHVAASAGCAYKLGRSEDGKTMPASLIFTIANVDINALADSRPYWDSFVRQATEVGDLHLCREDLQVFQGSCRPNEVTVNTTRILGLDFTEAHDLTKAELLGRQQVNELMAFFRKYVPGCENAYIDRIGAQVGVRETRRIMGEYVLTGEDIVCARRFPDVIARGAYGVDLHDADGPGTHFAIEMQDESGRIVQKQLPVGQSYDIPFRCLCPLRVEQILVAGRCISATREALSAIRIMPVCFSLGQAAGIAAAIAVQRGIKPREVDVAIIQRALIQQGANIGTAQGVE